MVYDVFVTAARDGIPRSYKGVTDWEVEGSWLTLYMEETGRYILIPSKNIERVEVVKRE